MAAFSRRLGLGLDLTQHFFSCSPRTATKTCLDRPMAAVARATRRSPIILAARSLQTSTSLRASKQVLSQSKSKSRAPAPRASSKPSAKPPAKAPARAEPAHAPAKRATTPPAKAKPSQTSRAAVTSLAENLAARGSPTVLYQSPSQFWLRFSSLSAATFLISFAGINYYTTLAYPPAGLPWWVGVAFAMVCLVSAGFGYLFLFNTARIVRRITAVPTRSLPASYLNGGKKLTAPEETALQALRASPIALECEIGGTLPLLGRRKFIAAPSNVLLPFKFVQAPVSQQHVQSSGAKGLRGAFYGLRQGLTSEGFAPIMINGKRCKIDVFGGEVLDHGKPLDVLMPYRPERFSNTWLDRILKR